MLQKVGDLTERRLEVAEYLQNLPAQAFDMHSCQRCIAGHICSEFVGLNPYMHIWPTILGAATAYLGLTKEEGIALFQPHSVYTERYTPHPHDAARVMRYLAGTGTVDWDVGGRLALYAAA